MRRNLKEAGTLAVQSASAMGMIKAIYIATPMICFGVVAVLMLFYKLDIEMPGIMQELERRKKEKMVGIDAA